MKTTRTLIAVLTLLVSLVSYVSGQNGEFEGSAESNLGNDRLIDYTSDTEINFQIVEGSGTRLRTVTRKTADCVLLNLPSIGFNFKGNDFTRAYVCANGLVKFQSRSYEVNPRNFGTYGGQSSDSACLAPYWSFVNLDYFQSGESKVFFRKYEDSNNDFRGVFTEAGDYGNTILNKTDYNPFWVTVITWVDLRPKQPGDVTYGGKNTFQLFLANGANNDAFAVYIYKDIDWSVGVIRNQYPNYAGSSDLPVVGFNSGQAGDEYPYDNFENSGSVEIEEVDDFIDSGRELKERGKIGIDLRKKVLAPPTSAERCQSWVSQQLFNGMTRRSCPITCPPTLSLAKLQSGARWYSIVHRPKQGNSIFPNYCIFSPSWRREDAGECCYSYYGFSWFQYYYYDFFSGGFNFFPGFIFNRNYNGFVLNSFPTKGVGHWYPYHPQRNFAKYLEEEDAYSDCCTQSDSTLESCSKYYSIRPTCRSFSWFFPTTWASMFGDPHFVSLDGKNYTFNGCGWFTYFTGEIPGDNESSLVVQVRTTRVGDVNATGFTGIAVKEGNTEVVQVNLRPGGGLQIQVDRSDFTPSSNATTLDSGIILSLVNNTFEIGTPLGSGVRINEAANGTFFTFVTAFLSSYENSSVGLAGKWNGNMEDDFTLPDGTVLPINMNNSEIFYNFGEAWRVPNNEKIYENIDDDNVEFACPVGFVPIFIDEALADMEPSLRAEAERVCGDDISCLFDIAATKDVSIGESTLSEITTINNEISQVENRLPMFTQNLTVINVTLGERFNLVLDAEDPDDDELTFNVPALPPGASFSSSGNQLIFSWLVNSAEMVNLTFLVQDTKNGSATLSPNIQLCRCVNGECFVPEATSEQEAAIENTFLVMSCNCPFGYTGEFCGEVRDFCAGELTPPCNPLVTCTNSAAGFACGDCPNGYEGNGQICSDIDECEGNQTVCDQICTNTVSSYFCGCNDGFSLDSDERTCSDIDECSKPNNCSQLCNNTVGSYECYCRIGFLINPDDPTTCTAKVQCDANNDCVQICYIDPVQVGQEKCDCNLGYSLRESDMKSCDDIDECQSTQDNLCDQTCTNTVGSYSCSCLAGYSFTSPATCTDINECLTGDFTCNGVGEECENIPGSYRCACSKRLNMVRVNGTCIFREDDSIVADLAPAPPTATPEQTNNAIQITLANFQEANYTVEADVLFKDSVVKLLNDFCNENTLRPQDCGVEQNQLLFSELNVKRLPSYPSNQGNDAIIRFYVDYPSIVRNATVDQAILASIVSAELQKFRDLTGFSITLDTSVTPPSPGIPTAAQSANAVQLLISSFLTSQWTTFYDTVFRRAVVVTLNRYCEVDTYSRAQDCGLSVSQRFDIDNIARLQNNPIQSGENVQVSFYVNRPSNTADPVVLQSVLASMLVIRESDLESALSQQVQIQTSAAPATPPTATSEQTTNSVVIRISSFDANRWTYLNDRRLRSSIASRVASYCGGHLVDCQIQTGGPASFTEVNVQRTSTATPSDVGGNSVDYSFYVKYPSGETPIIQYILASVVKIELDAMQSESTLFFSLQTSFQPPPPTAPNSDQSSNTIEIKIRNQQANQWHGIQDNQLRVAIATQIASYCTSNLVTCGVTSDQVSFNSLHVTRIESSPVQDGDNVTYTFFVNYPSGNGPIQRNLLAGILTAQTVAIETATNLSLSVETSTLAATPPVASSDQSSKAIIVSTSNIQWSAIQDNKFRGYVAQAIAEYCQASVSQTQECELPANQASFTISHVQLVTGPPSQDGGGNVDIQFYVDYPGGGTMSQAILLLIINQKEASIETNTGLQLTVVTTIVIPTALPPSPENTDNAISVVLKDFQADQWYLRDTLFRQNMAEEIKAFCGMSTYHRDICNISDADVNGFTSDHIRRLPNSPRQNGTDSTLSFYAVLPSGSGSLPKSVLATIFTSQQDSILSVNSELEKPSESISSSETPALTPAQTQNTVAITIFNFKSGKVNTLVVVDIRVTVAAKMNIFCFSTSGDVCGLTVIARRKKRTIGDQFTQKDVIVDGSSVMPSGNNTVLGVVVNQPGTVTPVESSVVGDALHQTIQEDGQTQITNLTLGVVNAPTVSDNQRDNAISVRLTGTQPSEWTLQQDISFRNNMSEAIVLFCGQSDARLASCNLTRDQLNEIDFQNIQILPNSPAQDGDDSILSFFVNLPGGATMPSDLLDIIYSSSPNVISQPTVLNTTMSQNPSLTEGQIENLVPLTVNGRDPTQDVRLDVQTTIANRLNVYCRNNSGDSICSANRTFTKDDVLVQIDPATSSVRFVVLNPQTRSPVSASSVQNAISGEFMSDLLGLTFTVPQSTGAAGDDEVDWPLILGLSIGGALLFLFVILSIIIGVVNTSKATKFKEYGFENESMSVYSARGWQFDRESPYSGSPFASIDAIPGFDEDGLPSDARPDTRV